MRASPMSWICLLAMIAWCRPALAAESYANCTGFVTSLPTTIGASGTWCVKANLASGSSTARAITVNADNVTLDCNDFMLGGTAGTANTAIGVYAQNRQALTVRHCNIQGFRYGVFLAGASGGSHVVEDNHFDLNTFEGVHVEGDGSVVRHNEVLDTGGTTTSAQAYGIYAAGAVSVEDNSVSAVTARTGGNGNAYGIYTSADPDGSISYNRVRGMAKDGTGKDYGIFNSASGRVALRENDVFGDSRAGSVGLTCKDSTGRARDNMIGGFATALKSCGDGGENDIGP